MGLCAATGEETDIAQGEELQELVREVGAESKYLMCATHASYSIAQHGAVLPGNLACPIVNRPSLRQSSRPSALATLPGAGSRHG